MEKKDRDKYGLILGENSEETYRINANNPNIFKQIEFAKKLAKATEDDDIDDDDDDDDDMKKVNEDRKKERLVYDNRSAQAATAGIDTNAATAAAATAGHGRISRKNRRMAKYGIIRRRYDIPNTEGSGWRAPRLHNLVRPLKKFNMGETPEQIVGEQKDALDERRSNFKDQAMFQRGVYPSKDEIESAFPKTVEPFMPDPRNIPKTGIILHPFIFPSKKYMVKTGVF